MITDAEIKPECIVVSELNLGYVNLAIFCYGLPMLLFLVCMYALHAGISVYKYKVTPPPNIPALTTVAPKPSKYPQCLLLITLLFSLGSMYAVYYGHNLYNQIAKGKSIELLISEIDFKC